ncbi:MAG: hypothetical protein MEP57_08415 [Microvirga sp.]|nr:hypothetical protein [Microvirga sp.]
MEGQLSEEISFEDVEQARTSPDAALVEIRPNSHAKPQTRIVVLMAIASIRTITPVQVDEYCVWDMRDRSEPFAVLVVEPLMRAARGRGDRRKRDWKSRMTNTTKRSFSRLCGAKERRKIVMISNESEPSGVIIGVEWRTARDDTHPRISEITP